MADEGIKRPGRKASYSKKRWQRIKRETDCSWKRNKFLWKSVFINRIICNKNIKKTKTKTKILEKYDIKLPKCNRMRGQAVINLGRLRIQKVISLS